MFIHLMFQNNMKEKEKHLVANRIITPDGTMLWSRHTHDYVEYKDNNGETYMVDGGNDYQRSIVNKVPAKDACVYSDAPWEEIRQVALRGTFNDRGMQIWVPLCKLSDNHLQGILEYNKQFNNTLANVVYLKEIAYRKTHNISIPDHKYADSETVLNITKIQ